MRFNPVSEARKPAVNLAGGPANAEDPKTELALLTLTSFVEDQFYRKAKNLLERVRALVAQVEPEFVAKLGIFARDNCGMRSISHALAVEVLPKARGSWWIRGFYDQIVMRADDVTEILSYLEVRKRDNDPAFGKGIPNSMKIGLGRALARMSDYQLAKYRGGTRTLKLVDAANLLHPPRSPALDKLINGTLLPADTWEVALTEAGSDQALKTGAWRHLIATGKIGYFALLRNLRNIIQQAPEMVPMALEILVDPERIRKSRVLPFRFQTAAQQIMEMGPGLNYGPILTALSRAADLSLENTPMFEGRTAILVDVSGSMYPEWSALGRKAPIFTACLFAASLFRRNNAHVIVYSNGAEYVALNPVDSLFTLAGLIQGHMRPGGTNVHAAFEVMTAPYDRIVLLSDMQAWMNPGPLRGAFEDYCRRAECRPRIFSFDLSGYGTTELPSKDICCLAGFSEKAMTIMRLLESDKDALIHEIERVPLCQTT